MPPGQKRHRCNANGSKQNYKNPRVVLRPLLADQSRHCQYRFATVPSSASLFNNSELSDITLHVGDNVSFYAHRLILSAGSDVFKNMLDGRWSDNKKQEIKLQEDDECIEHFHRFLQYLYSGSIVISESYVLALFMLADKYNVKPLYTECVKVIEKGLKVFPVKKKTMEDYSDSPPFQRFVGTSSSNSSESDSTDDLSESDSPSPTSNMLPQQKLLSFTHVHMEGPSTSSTDSALSDCLVASEVFALHVVIKMLMFCNNQRIQDAAFFNLEVRLSKQITNGNFAMWNDLSKQILEQLLSDDYFNVKEFTIFEAVKAWLQFSRSRLQEDIVASVLSKVRFATMTSEELYCVQKDSLVKNCPITVKMVNEAIKYQLFKDCCSAEDKEMWQGPLFKPRVVKLNI